MRYDAVEKDKIVMIKLKGVFEFFSNVKYWIQSIMCCVDNACVCQTKFKK